MKTKKWLIGITILALLIGISIAWNDQGNENIKKIHFPTAGASGPLYSVGAALTHMWNQEIPGMRAAEESSPGGIFNIRMVADGEAEISIAVAGDIYQAMHGEGAFEGENISNLRAVAGLYLNPNQVIVSDASGIQTLQDMKGKRIAIASAGSSVYGECKTHLAAAGILFSQDIKAEYITLTDGQDMITNGRLDGAWVMAGVPASSVAQALTAGAKLLDIDRPLIQRIQEKYPWHVPYTIPKGSYANQDKEIHTTAVKMILFTRNDIDEETIYEMTKKLWNYIEHGKNIPAPLKGLTVKDGVTGLDNIPLHPGAERYYKEIGAL